MSNFMGADIREYYWKPYPGKTQEQIEAFNVHPDDMFKLSPEKRANINKLKSEYVGTIQAHRAEGASNYNFLKDSVLPHFTKEDNGAGIGQTKALLMEHARKEQNINSLTTNRAFRSLKYTE